VTLNIAEDFEKKIAEEVELFLSRADSSQNLLNLIKNLTKPLTSKLLHTYSFKGVPLIKISLKGKYTDVLFIGDLHGDLESLIKVVEYTDKLIKEKKKPLLIFLGDYVDRGPKQLECLVGVMLLANKILPGKTIMLRGNHETPLMNQYYGFLRDLASRLGVKQARAVYMTKILPLYKSLAVACLVEDWRSKKIFAAHGGIPVIFSENGWRTPDFNEIEKIQLSEDYDSSSLAFQILWNDPDENIEEYSPSFRGSGIYVFGSKIVEDFMRRNTVSLIVRSHLAFPPRGYRVMFGGKLVSIFTCRYYQVPPSILHLTESERKIVDVDTGEILEKF